MTGWSVSLRAIWVATVRSRYRPSHFAIKLASRHGLALPNPRHIEALRIHEHYASFQRV